MTRNATIAVVQPLRRRPGEPPMTVDENLAQAVDLLGRVPEGTDAVCFPEFFATASTDGEKTLPLAEIASHTPRFLEVLGKLGAKRRNNLVLCLPHEDRNVTFLLDRRGHEAGRYVKCHLPPSEAARGVVAGDALPVVKLDFAKVGVLVCYDIYFPEPARVMALAGAEVLFHPTRVMNAPSEKAFEALCLARAVENVCWFAASSFCPPPPFEYGTWQARSFVADPNGMILAEVGREPGVAIASVDLGLRTRRLEGYLWEEFRRARRPELYRTLTSK
ncbi:MAG TPA: carbon-nitrogen hydrolase family protein [Planctomycetota bacterium]|nr:carbon-nitrogen hydrolase family protein [Planctomycetota bacterium]